MAKHPDKLRIEGVEISPEYLAAHLSCLRYDVLATFLHALADTIHDDGLSDARRGRVQLSDDLKQAAAQLDGAAFSIEDAWKICQKHMPKEKL